jgi:hypothetical protein
LPKRALKPREKKANSLKPGEKILKGEEYRQCRGREEYIIPFSFQNCYRQ